VSTDESGIAAKLGELAELCDSHSLPARNSANQSGGFSFGESSLLMHTQCATEVLGAARLARQLAAGGAWDSASREETHIGDGQTVTV
jgi:hypothetical protein